jgi:hypothetical protein
MEWITWLVSRQAAANVPLGQGLRWRSRCLSRFRSDEIRFLPQVIIVQAFACHHRRPDRAKRPHIKLRQSQHCSFAAALVHSSRLIHINHSTPAYHGTLKPFSIPELYDHVTDQIPSSLWASSPPPKATPCSSSSRMAKLSTAIWFSATLT